MRVFKPTERHRCWHVEFSVQGVKRRVSSYQRDEALAKEVGAMLDMLAGARATGAPADEPPARLHAWLTAMPEGLRMSLTRFGLVDAAWWVRREMPTKRAIGGWEKKRTGNRRQGTDASPENTSPGAAAYAATSLAVVPPVPPVPIADTKPERTPVWETCFAA